MNNITRRTFMSILCIMLLVTMSVGIIGCGTKKTNVKLGTGGKGGNYYSYGQTFSDYLAKDGSYSLTVKETGGSVANIRLLSDGYLDMALVQSDILTDAVEGKGDFDTPTGGFHSVVSLYSESCQIVVSTDSKIDDIYDLRGKRVSLGADGSGTQKNAVEILNAAGIAVSNIDSKNMTYEEASKALKNHEIDAFFVTSSYPVNVIGELTQSGNYKVLDIPDNVIDTLLNKSDINNKGYQKSIIPANTYTNQTKDIVTVGVEAVLVASDKLDKNVEDSIVTILKDNQNDIKDISFGMAAKDEKESKNVLDINMYLTLTLAVLVLYVGAFLKKKIKFLETFCIPAPVVGGLLFATLSCVLYVLGIVEFSFDETFKNICMIMFFTSVGFQANFKVLKSGGKGLVVFLICIIGLIVAQNGIAVGIAKVLGLSPLIGLCTGSIPMVGGHGTAGAFGQVLQDLGVEGATTLCTAAATFGLVMGSVMGGPIGRRLIEKKKLLDTVVAEDDSILVEDELHHKRHINMYASASYQLAIAMGIGTIVSTLLSKTGMTFPVYIGAMIVAAIMRNIGEYSGKIKIHMGEINDIGGICLSLFLGVAMVTLKLWQLAALALPLFILLAGQTVFMALFAYFVVYNVMGRNYDAAVLSAGTCGFGMGATPNAMANMQALTEKYAPSVKAYLLVPIVGSMFADFINSLTVTFFINLF